MKSDKIIACERKRFFKIVNFRLPHKFMFIGIAISGLSIILMFYRAFAMDGDTEIFKEVLKKTLLIGLLLMSLARDKEEDEMVIALRSQSYAIAFVVGVIYALIMPYIEFGVSNAVNDSGDLKELGDFQVLLFMLMIQLMFFHNLKRYR